MAERPPVRQAGWPQVLVLGGLVVALVLGLAVVTSLLPAEAQGIVFRTPLAIVVLVVATVGVLVALLRPRARR